jgi:acyl-CoA thioester hydrolase
LNVRASLVEWESRITMNYLVTRAADQERVARGKSVQVAVDAKTLALQFVTPEPLLSRVHQALMRKDLGTA